MEKMIGLPIFLLALIIEIYAFPPPPSLLPPGHVLVSLIKFRLTDLSRENDNAQDASQKGSNDASPTCPKTLSSITDSKNGNFYLFNDDNVWTLNNRTVISGPKKISQVFPNGPDYVNATVTSRDLTVLLEERTLYGYNQDEVTGEFKVAKGFPAKLHELVLFFPVAAFPLSNGSIILLSHFNAFATYNLFDNRPSLLNDKDVFFPGLPKDLASGIPENRVSDDFYMLFTKSQVYKYDNRLGEIVHAQPLSSYLVCK
uniref:Uncharacterized protein n=1 Tax=Acrobeloides nanus TaxID=290746 RepID=A0A914CE07_9BILA